MHYFDAFPELCYAYTVRVVTFWRHVQLRYYHKKTECYVSKYICMQKIYSLIILKSQWYRSVFGISLLLNFTRKVVSIVLWNEISAFMTYSLLIVCDKALEI